MSDPNSAPPPIDAYAAEDARKMLERYTKGEVDDREALKFVLERQAREADMRYAAHQFMHSWVKESSKLTEAINSLTQVVVPLVQGEDSLLKRVAHIERMVDRARVILLYGGIPATALYWILTHTNIKLG